MTIHFEIPKNIEEQLRSTGIDPTQTAKELFFVDLYRKERITHHQLAEAMGLVRYETDGVLKRHGVGIELSREEFRSQVESLRELRRQ
jgi:predicted HTH domain antitoxin